MLINPLSIENSGEINKSSKSDNWTNYAWLISADKIFESKIKGFEDYARFFYFEFNICKFSMFDGANSSDSGLCAEDVKVYLEPSRFCASIQGCLASKRRISKIIMQKVEEKSGNLDMVEKLEFGECFVQSFERSREEVAFTFRCTEYSDSYQDFNTQGKKSGNAAVKINLTTWKVS